jgi:dipeptidase E
MNILLTSTGPGAHLEIKKAFAGMLKKKPPRTQVFMVTTATKGSKDWKYVRKTARQLNGVGIATDNIRIFSFDRKITKSDLEGVDIILVFGGNTFLYLDKIRKTGLDKAIVNAVKSGVGYCGISAGSYVICPTIEAASWKHADRNTVHLKNLKGLNLVPFLVTAHFDESVRIVVQAAAKKTKYPVVALNDRQAIFVRDNFLQIIGSTEPSFIKWAK